MKRLFESKGIADAYVKYRPHTPPFIKEKALQFLRKRSAPSKDGGDKFGLMLDVGCGSGQSTKVFASDFNKVVGVDPSANQIKQAKKNNSLANINYMVGSGENLPAEDGTVDLIVVGQAVHWFDFDKFFSECARVLTPSGCFFAFGYTTPRVSCVSREGAADWGRLKAESDAIVCDFNDNKCRFDPRIQFLFDDYAKVFELIPSSDKERSVEREMEKVMSLESLSGYLSSFSGYHNHVTETVKKLMDSGMSEDEAARAYDEKHDILKETIGSLRKCWSVDPSVSASDVTLRVTWNVPMVMSARPQC